METKKAFGKIQNAMMDLDDYSEELLSIGKGLGMTEEEIQRDYPKLRPDWEGQPVEYDEEKDQYIQEEEVIEEDDLDTDSIDDETKE